MEKRKRDESKRTRPMQYKFNATLEEKQLIDTVKAKTNKTLTEIFLLGIRVVELEIKS